MWFDHRLEPTVSVTSVSRRKHLLALGIDDRRHDCPGRSARDNAQSQRLDRGDAPHRDAQGLPESERRRDTDTKTGESSGPDAHHDLAHVTHADA